MRLVSGSFGGWVATIPFIFLFYFFYDIAYTPLVVAYVVEILPFNIRSRGFAVMVSEQPLPYTVSLFNMSAGFFCRTRLCVSCSRLISL